MSWPENEDQWATICACEKPSQLNMAAIRLNEIIIPDIGDSVIDLRALSLREWTVEFLWKLKEAEVDFKVILLFCLIATLFAAFKGTLHVDFLVISVDFLVNIVFRKPRS